MLQERVELDEHSKRVAVGRLQLTKFIRSTGQGALVVAFSLYLKELGWSGTSIGVLLTAGGLVTAFMGLAVGAASDRLGRKSFVLCYETAIILAAVILAVTAQPLVLIPLCVLTGIGRSQSGMPGPVAAAEQAWIAEVVPAVDRGMVYSINSSLAFIGMGIGAVIVGQIHWWETLIPGAARYRPLFLLVGFGALINLIMLYCTPGGTVTNKAAPGETISAAAARTGAAEPAEAAVSRDENTIMLKMAFVNSLNGVAVGLTSPLLSYWFALRFGTGPDAIGPVFAVTYFVTGAATLVTGRMSRRVGIVRAVVAVRLASVIFMLLQPLIPHFHLAAAVFVLRSALARSSVGARQALAVSLVRQTRRGVASSINSISMQLPNSLGPSMAGAMMEAGHMSLPFYTAAGLQFVFGVLYGRIFQRYDPQFPDYKPRLQIRRTAAAD